MSLDRRKPVTDLLRKITEVCSNLYPSCLYINIIQAIKERRNKGQRKKENYCEDA